MLAKRTILLLCTVLLGGCGLKGDLYLPKPEQPAEAPQPTASEQPASATAPAPEAD